MILADSQGNSSGSLLLQYAVLPVLWPISLLGLLNGDLSSGALATLVAWLTLFFANMAGNRQRKAAAEGRTGEDLFASGGEEEIVGSEEN